MRLRRTTTKTRSPTPPMRRRVVVGIPMGFERRKEKR
jgi:hypothetical protein